MVPYSSICERERDSNTEGKRRTSSPLPVVYDSWKHIKKIKKKREKETIRIERR
jgi:hypothetical protein